MEVISPFHYFRLYVRMRLLAERISKHSAKGNTAGGILCGIIVQKPYKVLKLQNQPAYMAYFPFRTLDSMNGRQKR